MKSSFTNPIIVKELRERFRSKKAFWTLALFLVIMGGIPLGFLIVNPIKADHLGQSKDLFIISATIHYAMICFFAPALTAGAISGERERQTLNILLTTQLSPRSIVWSKLFTSLAFTSLLLVASMPLYSMVMLYGSVSPGQLLKLSLFFAVNILFLGTLGLFCSTWIKRTAVSTVIAYGIAFFFVVGTGLIFYFVGEMLVQLSPDKSLSAEVWSKPHMQYLAGTNPIIVLFSILGEGVFVQIGFDFTPWLFFSSVYLVLSLLLVLWSAYLLAPIRRKRWSWKK
ncbi:ABC transporter permease subunit [Brevibacillus composti]|uniref:ABC transporter permease subunit n=1 Tax=Brevibacillus composti TaxID=2796470 RepID=A0A7T5EPC4_9BACL|nr:ABC transporter permease subunit [Brevibacillus composti]QQE76285.1 ABC transporter permease subunit [Brevibacillus composti]QUO43313.1 ABC transporter permease subunit [Brevibacillus composti]